MRLYRRRKSNGEWVWWASWTDGGRTIRWSTRATTKAAAELVVARWERERADPIYAAAQSATFGGEASLFLKACEGAVERGKMAPETLGMYRQKAGTLVRILGAGLRLAAIDGSTFQGFLDVRREQFLEDRGRPITESNLYKEWVTFRQILKGAWRGQRFNRDPGSLKPEHFSAEYVPRDTFLTEVQANALLAELDGDRKRTVAFVLGTGARRREWERAQDGDITPDQVHLRGTKTEKSDRTIPILAPTRRWARLAGKPPFPRWTNARRDIHAACVRAGVPLCTWNDLRRTFASRLALAGIQSDVGRRLMGHGSEKMWNLVYARASTQGLREMAERQLRRPARRMK
jgi:integrase